MSAEGSFGKLTLEDLIDRTREMRREWDRVRVETLWRDRLAKAEIDLASVEATAGSIASEARGLAACLRTLHNRIQTAAHGDTSAQARTPIRESGRHVLDASAGFGMSDAMTEVSESAEAIAYTLAAYWVLDASAGDMMLDYADRVWFSVVEGVKSKTDDAHEEARAARTEYRRLNAAVARLLAENERLRSQVRLLEAGNKARAEWPRDWLAENATIPLPVRDGGR